MATCTFHAGRVAPSASFIARTSGSEVETAGSGFAASALACDFARSHFSSSRSASVARARRKPPQRNGRRCRSGDHPVIHDGNAGGVVCPLAAYLN